ncbi:MAG: hypothetical protein HC877_15580 [Thioploca sp.]|nr:hypothetical protein [Thioploca sp.]
MDKNIFYFFLITILLLKTQIANSQAQDCSIKIISLTNDITETTDCVADEIEAERSIVKQLCNCPADDNCGDGTCMFLDHSIVGNQPTINSIQPTDCEEGKSKYTVNFDANSIGIIKCDCECTLCDEEGRGRSRNLNDPSQCINLVQLSNFTANPTDKGISLNWTTKTELDSQGFKMWRAIPKLDKYCGCSGNIDDYTQIQVLDKEGKPVLIPAKGNTTSGSDYSYLDEGAKPGIAYCYALEDIDSKGESKFYFEYVAFTQDSSEESK